MDSDITNSTFSVLMNVGGLVTSATNASTFITNLNTTFTEDSDLDDYFIAFTAGANTAGGDVASLEFVCGDNWRINFEALPVGLGNLAAGDLLKTTGFTNEENNGFWLINSVDVSGNGSITFTNTQAIAEIGNGSALGSQKRQVSRYQATGSVATSTAFSNTPTAADPCLVIPRTTANVVDYLNNVRITSLSTKAAIEASSVSTRVQISSYLDG